MVRQDRLAPILDLDVSDQRNAYTALYNVKTNYSLSPASGFDAAFEPFSDCIFD